MTIPGKFRPTEGASHTSLHADNVDPLGYTVDLIYNLTDTHGHLFQLELSKGIDIRIKDLGNYTSLDVVTVAFVVVNLGDIGPYFFTLREKHLNLFEHQITALQANIEQFPEIQNDEFGDDQFLGFDHVQNQFKQSWNLVHCLQKTHDIPA
jgi:hypothetical protein